MSLKNVNKSGTLFSKWNCNKSKNTFRWVLKISYVFCQPTSNTISENQNLGIPPLKGKMHGKHIKAKKRKRYLRFDNFAFFFWTETCHGCYQIFNFFKSCQQHFNNTRLYHYKNYKNHKSHDAEWNVNSNVLK